jgi:hypothetical protein
VRVVAPKGLQDDIARDRLGQLRGERLDRVACERRLFSLSNESVCVHGMAPIRGAKQWSES